MDLGTGQPNDHDRLVEVVTMVKDIHKAVMGNGQPGLIADVAALKAEMDDIKKQVPSSRERQAGWVAIVIAVLGTVGTVGAALAPHLPIQLVK